MRQEEEIRLAVRSICGGGSCISLRRGPMFVFDRREIPGPFSGVFVVRSVDITGAMLWWAIMGMRGINPATWLEHAEWWGDIPRGWIDVICDHFDVTSFWLWRFWMGVDRDHQIQIDTGKDLVDDEVCKWARRLGRELYSQGDYYPGRL